MEVPGHALKNIDGREGICECGKSIWVDKREASNMRRSRLIDAVIDEHRKHLKEVENGHPD